MSSITKPVLVVTVVLGVLGCTTGSTPKSVDKVITDSPPEVAKAKIYEQDKISAQAKDFSWIERNFTQAPPADLMASERRTLRWVDLIGDRLFRGGDGVVAVSPDGKWLVSGMLSPRGAMTLWEAATGREIRKLVDPILLGEVDTFSISPDGTWIASASLRGVIIWDVETGKQRLMMAQDCIVTSSIAVSLDGRFIAFGCRILLRDSSASLTKDFKQLVGVWDAATGKQILTFDDLSRAGKYEFVGSASFSPDGKKIVTSGTDAVKVWDVVSGRQLRTLQGYAVDAMFSADGKHIVSAHRTYGPAPTAELKIWDEGTGALIHKIVLDYQGEPAIDIDPSGEWFVAASNSLDTWDIATGKLQRTFAHEVRISDVAISPDGLWFVTLHDDGRLRLWDSSTGEELTISPNEQPIATSLAISPDGSFLISGNSDETLTIRDVATGKERMQLVGHVHPYKRFFAEHAEELSGDPPPLPKVAVTTTAVSPDGTWIVSGALDGLRVWDVASGKERWNVDARIIEGPMMMVSNTNAPLGVAVDPRGRWMVAAYFEGMLEMRDPATGKLRRTLKGGEAFGGIVAVSPDGAWIVSGSPAEPVLRIWDSATGKMRHRLHGHTHGITSVATSPGGKWVVSAGDITLKVWNVATGQLMLTLLPPEQTAGQKLSEADLFKLSQGDFRKLIDLMTRQVAVTSDGEWIVSASASELHIWKSTTGELMDSIRINGGDVTSLAIHGNQIWVGLQNSTINVYKHLPEAQ